MIMQKLSKMGLALILGGLFVSGCGGPSDATEDWKTYSNDEHGYSFAYPMDQCQRIVNKSRPQRGAKNAYVS